LWLPTRDTVAIGMAIGVFIGLMPFLGLQIGISVLLCFAFRVNVTTAVVATFISNPFTAGPILAAQLYLGKWMVGPLDPAELASYTGVIKYWVSYGKPIMFGAAVTASIAALLAYVLTLMLWTGVKTIGGKAIAARQAHKHAHEQADEQAQEPGDPASRALNHDGTPANGMMEPSADSAREAPNGPAAGLPPSADAKRD
jgi:uncharacterized protein (DUF2062 family)